MTKALVLGSPIYYEPVRPTGLTLETNPESLDTEPEKISLVVFTGGEDVSPALYGHPNLGSWVRESRDKLEKVIFEKTLSKNIPMLGICRGSQFLCVMAGGSLVQDSSGHAGPNHPLKYVDESGNVAISPEPVTSTHHQIQYPFDLSEDDYKILAWADKPRSRMYAYKNKVIQAAEADENLRMEPDVVYYPKINALGIQYHPEYMSRHSWGFNYAVNLINKYLVGSNAINTK